MSATINLARVREDRGYRDELRLRAQTDLFWLCYELLGYNKLTEADHRAVTNHYVQKDPRKPIFEQDTIKNRLHLDPRGTFKSTINMGDCVQWVIGFPENSGLLLSGALKLAQAFVGEVTQHFVKARGSSGSAFQELFPEFCIVPSEVRVGSYRAPHRQTARKDDTIMSGSMESAMSGWHFEWMKEDDIVDNRNAETPQGIEKTKKNRHINRKMLMPGGFRDTAGTRYDPFDAYGDDIAKARPGKIKILCRPALTLVSGERLTADAFPEEDECELTFPTLLSYEFLKESYEDDYSSFMTQYMNDAYGGKTVMFTSEAIAAATIDGESSPVQGAAHITWRFSYSGNPAMKYAGAAVGRMQMGRMFILEVVRGIWPPSVQARKVIELARKHDTRTVQIVSTPGSRHMEQHIHNAAIEAGYKVMLRWIPCDQDDGDRDLRLKSLEPMIATGRVYFSDEIAYMTDLIRQFTNFGMVEQNEIVECIARVCEALPRSIGVAPEEEDEDEQMELERQRDMHDRVYGVGRYAAPEAIAADVEEEVEEEYVLPTNPYALEDIMPGLRG
jgi:predicted phage terminase large subunit-like protein